MILKGQGFTYWLNNEQLDGFDAFEKALKNKTVTIEVANLEVRAITDEVK